MCPKDRKDRTPQLLTMGKSHAGLFCRHWMLAHSAKKHVLQLAEAVALLMHTGVALRRTGKHSALSSARALPPWPYISRISDLRGTCGVLWPVSPILRKQRPVAVYSIVNSSILRLFLEAPSEISSANYRTCGSPSWYRLCNSITSASHSTPARSSWWVQRVRGHAGL